MGADEAERYLPTLDDLRAAAGGDERLPRELSALEPSSTAPLAAIVLEMAMLRRESWSGAVELSETLYKKYPRGALPEPTTFDEASYQLVDEAHSTRAQRCTSCFITNGYVFCVVCGGSGARDPAGTRCEGCDGRGTVLCGACDGTGKTVRATIVHVNDHPIVFRRAFFPELPPGVAPRIEALLATLARTPDALRFELQPSVVGSAYRGASAVRAPDFRGHTFGGALDRAVAAVADVPRYGHVVRTEVRSYAWPVLVARYDAVAGRPRDFAIFRDESGKPCWIEAASPNG
jgi:hypothetical protein